MGGKKLNWIIAPGSSLENRVVLFLAALFPAFDHLVAGAQHDRMRVGAQLTAALESGQGTRHLDEGILHRVVEQVTVITCPHLKRHFGVGFESLGVDHIEQVTGPQVAQHVLVV